jgi:hypothetical protein
MQPPESLLRRWRLAELEPLKNEGPSSVWLARQGQILVVAKRSSEPDDEARALERFDASGVTPRLLERDGDWLLLEHIAGELLSERPWDWREQALVGAGLRRIVLAPAPGDPPFRDRSAGWLRSMAEPLPAPIYELHERLCDLVFCEESFTHSDLKPDNVIVRPSGEMAFIDPFGRLGPAAFDIAHHGARAVMQSGAPAASVTVAALVSGYGEEPPLLDECRWLLTTWHLGRLLAGQDHHAPDEQDLIEELVDVRYPLIEEARAALAERATPEPAPEASVALPAQP